MADGSCDPAPVGRKRSELGAWDCVADRKFWVQVKICLARNAEPVDCKSLRQEPVQLRLKEQRLTASQRSWSQVIDVPSDVPGKCRGRQKYPSGANS